MRVIDLFAGIGGFSLAAHWLGWETLCFVEKDEFCQKVLAKNFPGVDIYGDIHEFDGTKYRGTADIVCGGFPCQPFSQAGQQKGREDERHLFPQMLRVISEVKPKFVVAENVRGLLSNESGDVFEEIASRLEGEGYEVATFYIPACAVNAPHRRDRIWIIANSDNKRELQQKRFERNFGRRTGNGDSSIITDSESGNISQSFANRNSGGQQKSQTGKYDCGIITDSAKQRLSFAGLTNIGQLQKERRERLDDRFEFGDSQSTGWSRNWIDVAFTTCVRGMDDGISAGLDIIGSRDNRTNRLKALGNAIVPQIALELFKAIEYAET